MIEYNDSSVVVNWFRDEEKDHEKARVLLRRIENFDATFVFSEFGLGVTI